MKQTAVEYLVKTLELDTRFNGIMNDVIDQAKAMEKEHELKTKIICWKEALQFINDNYMVELINIRIYNMEVELETFKSE